MHVHIDCGPLSFGEILDEANTRLSRMELPPIEYSGARGDHGEYCFEDITPLQASILHTVATEKGATTDYEG